MAQVEIKDLTADAAPAATDVLAKQSAAGGAGSTKKSTLADWVGAAPPQAHAASHTDGSDDIQDATAAQKGVATAAQITKLDGIAALADVTGANAPQAHAASHQNAGGDEISVAGLSGELADAQPPKLHASDHTDGTDDIQSATAAQKGVATAAQITKLDGIATGAQVNVDRFELQADQFEFPISGDRPASIDNLAPTTTDGVNAGLQVLAFDDTDEEARVWSRRIFPGALTMTVKALWRAAAAPGDALHDIGWKLYWREIPIAVAPSLTWAGTNDGSKTLTEIADIANDVLFHETTEVITLASEGILLDREYQFMLSRVTPAGTNLVGDWLVRRLAVEFA